MYAVLALPIPTISHASDAKRDGGFGLVGTGPCADQLVGTGFTNPYHAADLGWPLPCETFTNLYHRIEGLGMTEYYVGLELVVGGAVDEGDVVLFFIGQHIGTSSEVFDRLVWRFDIVGDLTGILTTRH